MPYIELERSAGVAVIWMDQPGEKANKISADLLAEFARTLDGLERDPDVRGIVLASRKDDFIAGADLEQFLEMGPGEARKLSRRGHALLDRMASFPKPIVAAINGAALGGGLEVALACAGRIASDDPRTVLALPEVKLGLLPGGAGTQRLPRLVGIREAMGMMLTGRNVFPRKAHRIGLVDATIHRYGLLDAARKMALDLAEKRPDRKKKQTLASKILESNSLGRRLIYDRARKTVLKQTFGNYPAPLRIIECVETGMEQGYESGLYAEETKFDELVQSPQARQLINVFFGMTALKKNPLKAAAKRVSSIGVLGAGLMGSGIAQVSAASGFETMLKDVSLEAVGRGEKAVWKSLAEKVRQGSLSAFQRDLILNRIRPVMHYQGLGSAGLVIEAVFEDLKVKRQVLAETEEAVRDDAIFASNTSSIPISQIAAGARRPGQVIGMHYFSPVPAMPLLEIITTDLTPEWVKATAVEVGIRQGKSVIVVRDGPGFYTTRILAPLVNEALVLVEEGGDIREIDKALRRFGFAVGPLTLLDEIGIDVAAHIATILAPLFAARGVEPKNISKALVQAGYRGRKNRRGFYVYRAGKKTMFGKKKPKEVNREIYRMFGGPSRTKIEEDLIQNRLPLVMINEAVHCLQEEILASPRDGDLGAVLGLGFPPFLGGPFRYIDSLGPAEVLSRLEKLENRYGPRFSPAPLLRDQAGKSRRFYR